MHIIATGLNHRTAPLWVREALSLSYGQLPQALASLKEQLGHGVVVSTCNRTEVYTVAPDGHHGSTALDSFYERQFGIPTGPIQPYLYTLEQEAAVRHLFRVTTSLDSLIIGESEILGQVRDAYSLASRHGSAGGVLAKLFHAALRVGKRARAETAIGRNALSISRACVAMARRRLGNLAHRRVLVVGAGDAGRLAARAARDAGVASLVLANRTPAHAQDLAGHLEAELAPLDALPDLLQGADLVISATGAPEFVVAAATVEKAMAARPDRPLCLIDVAMPRDVDPAAAQVPGVSLYTMEDMEMAAEANRKEREAETLRVEEIVDEEVARFHLWWQSLEVRPTVAAIRRRAEAVRANELQRALQALGALSGSDRARIEAMSKALVKKVLHQPTRSLYDRRDQALTRAARELFGLDQA